MDGRQNLRGGVLKDRPKVYISSYKLELFYGCRVGRWKNLRGSISTGRPKVYILK